MSETADRDPAGTPAPTGIPSPASTAGTCPIPWAEAHREALDHLKALLAIDTTNPPGHERAAVDYICGVLRAAGIEPTVIEPSPLRANVIARLAGSGQDGPLLLSAHLDVVEPGQEPWTHPPFGAVEAGGYIWGRGAVDMKNMAAMALTVMTLLKRSGAPLRRDLILACVADEEMSCRYGSAHLVDHHADRVRAQWVLTELGGFSQDVLGVRFYPVQVAEKGLCWMRLTARGPAGHGSMPDPRNAVATIARAVARLHPGTLGMRPTPTTRRMFEAMAQQLSMPAGLVMRALLVPALAPMILGLLPDRSLARSLAAILSDTVSPTVLRGGGKTNVIPDQASVDLDGRFLPDTTVEEFVQRVRTCTQEDVEVEVLDRAPAIATAPDGELWEIIRAVLGERDPAGTVIPALIPGFTDSKHYVRLGARCLGFSPVRFDATHNVAFASLFHGRDERIPVDGFCWGLECLHEVVRRACCAAP